MIVALTNLKGGVGKSTISVHLAVWLSEQGKKVVLVDTDVQAGSSTWLQEAAPEIKNLRLQTPDDILEEIPKLQGDYEHIIVDGPAGLAEVTRTILLLTDLTLLPCGPSVLDLRAARDAIRVVKQVQHIRKGPPKAILIPNKLQIQYRLSQEFLETATSLEIPTSSGLRLRQPFADAVGQGTVVWKLSSKSANEAAGEIQNLFNELLNHESASPSLNEPSIANG